MNELRLLANDFGNIHGLFCEIITHWYCLWIKRETKNSSYLAIYADESRIPTFFFFRGASKGRIVDEDKTNSLVVTREIFSAFNFINWTTQAPWRIVSTEDFISN